MRILSLALCGVLLSLTVAVAADLNSAKSNGWLGERMDGYLGLVDDGAPEQAKVLMQEINAKRRAKYAEIATSRGVSVDAVGRIAAKKVFDAAPDGTFFWDDSGSWKQK